MLYLFYDMFHFQNISHLAITTFCIEKQSNYLLSHFMIRSRRLGEQKEELLCAVIILKWSISLQVDSFSDPIFNQVKRHLVYIDWTGSHSWIPRPGKFKLG